MKKIIFFIIVANFIMSLSAAERSDSKKDLDDTHPTGSPGNTILNINNISTWVYPDGRSGNSPNQGPGAFFPRSTGNVLYLDGMVWGGMVKDGQTPELRVGGSTYRSGLQPGAILGIRTGTSEDPYADDVRIWRVRTDWASADLLLDASELNLVSPGQVSQSMIDQVRDQYEKDWNEWPWQKGAPYQDLNHNGQYDNQIDIPGIPGADQTLWFVANDLDASKTMYLAGSQPIGIELQVSFWAYDRPEGDPFGDVIFRHTRLIYKGHAKTASQGTIEDMYVTMWSDSDIGDYRNDFVGCDSSLGLAYGYNGETQDNEFLIYDLYPPAFGYLLMHGPVISSAGDTAIYDFSKRPGYKNQTASSFLFFASASNDTDPSLGDYEGTNQWYNLMRGLRPQAGTPWINPLTDQPTKFPLSGDPVESKGWIDGISYQASDRRMGITAGPFNMAIGDTQEVVFALLGNISSTGSTAYIKNISGLKRKAANIQNLIYDGASIAIGGNTLSRLNTPVDLTLYQLLFKPSESVQSLSWTLSDKPANSASNLSQSSGNLTSFTPDIAGLYRITAQIIVTGGNSFSTEFVVEATDNKNAIAHISLDKTDISWGDSVLADGSGSYDPDGDELEFDWYAEGSGVSTNTAGRKAYIYPRATGDHNVTLSLFDGYFESIIEKNFMVHPKTDSMTVKYSFIDTNWARNILYFHGDTLLVPIWQQDSLFVYDISDGNISKSKSIDLPDKQQVFKLMDNRLYIGSVGESGFFGPGKLFIYQVGPDWALTPLLEDYVPDIADISSMKFYNNGTFVTDVYNNLYRIDFNTNPSYPNILAQTNAFSMGMYGIHKVDNYVIIGSRGNYPDRFILRLSENTLGVVDTLDFPLNWRSFSIDKNLLFMTFTDSTVIYDISNITFPERQNVITTTSPVAWLVPGEYGSYYHISSGSAGNNLLGLHTTAGFRIYDISVPSNPSFIASYYSGMRGQSSGPTLRSVNGKYYATGQWDQIVYDDDIYSGINRIEFEIPQQTNLPDLAGMPLNYELYQNYPNPFNPSTTIEYYLPKKTVVSVDVFNVLGQKIITILEKKHSAGRFTVKWNGLDDSGSPAASGLYFYRLKTQDYEITRKMLLLR